MAELLRVAPALLHPGVLAQAAVFVEFEPQSRVEGEVQQMPAGFPVTELWQVLAGHHPGRANAAQVTVFDSVGFALEDYSALTFMRDAAVELGIGEVIALVPSNPNPKDLFGLLRPLPATAPRTGVAMPETVAA